MKAVIFLFTILVFTSFTTAGFGYNDLDGPILSPEQVPFNNNTAFVNNSFYWQGYTPATLWTYFTGLGNDLWCELTGCTMTGNINMDSNNLTNVNLIETTNIQATTGNFTNEIYQNGRRVSNTIDRTNSEDMVAYWQMEGNVEDSFGDHDGSVFPDVTAFDWIVGKAAYFNNYNNPISIPDGDQALDCSSSFAIEFWFQMLAPTGYLLNKPNYQIELTESMELKATVNGVTITSEGLIPGRPYHVVLTYDGTTLYLYINGVLVDSDALGSSGTSSDNLEIGEDFVGLIDEVAIYDSYFTSSMIQAHYHKTLDNAQPYNELSNYWVLTDDVYTFNGSINVTTLDLGTNTITDGSMTGDWDFGAGDLTATGDCVFGQTVIVKSLNTANPSAPIRISPTLSSGVSGNVDYLAFSGGVTTAGNIDRIRIIPATIVLAPPFHNTITDLINFDTSICDISRGTITNAYGYRVSEDLGGSTNNYGVYVADQTGATNDYAIKTGLGLVSFGDDVDIFGDISAVDGTFSGDLDVEGNIIGNQIYGGMFYHNHTGTTMSFASADTWYPLYFTDATDLNGFSSEGIAVSGVSNLTAQVAGVYRVDYMGIGSGQNNHIYLSTIMVNGIEKPECGHHHKMAAGGDVITQSGNCIITLAVGDDVGVSTQDMTGTGDGEYYGGNLNIVRIGNV